MIRGPVSLDLKADPEGLARLDDWMETAAAGWAAEAVLMKVRVCAAEIAANLLEHGSDPAAAAGLTVGLSGDDDGLWLELIDDGRPFDPTATRPAPERGGLQAATPGGRGLRTVQALAARLDYRREDGLNRLRILIGKG